MNAMIGNSLLLGGEGYQISRSVRLRSSASGYFSRTFSNAATNNLKGSLSIWTKRGTLGAQVDLISCYNGSSSASTDLYFNSSNQLQFEFGNTAANSLITTAVYRDPSAWYHIHLEVDTTQATASNRVKLYVNGVQVTAFGTANYPAQNTVFQIVSVNANNRIGTNWNNSGAFFDGYLTEINFIDGQALTPASFGETNPVTGVWQPKRYTGTYGTNGFYLNFSDNSAATAAAIGKDYSGNGNNWTPNNISVSAGSTYDSMLDVPTPYADGGNGRGNYCVLNPLAKDADVTLSNGNLGFSCTSAGLGGAIGTIAVTSGKWYWEVTVTGGTASAVGIAKLPLSAYDANQTGTYLYLPSGDKRLSPSTDSAYGASYTTNDVIGVALDMDAGTVAFYKNNSSQGTAFSSLSGDFTAWMQDGTSGSASSFVANFGQSPFAYTPPTGFKALNTLNLPEPTILKGNQYFDAVTRTGTGSSDGVAQVISSLAFTPDLVWNKARSNAFNHNLVDSARGNDAILFSNLTNAETSVGTTGTQLQLTTNGFTAIQRVSYQATNQNGVTYVDWCWKEGATQGFDIVTYTGNGANRTIAHNLGVAPRMILVKARSTAGYNWVVWHANLTSGGYYLNLNGTAAQALDTTVWNNTAPTSSVFSVGTSPPANNNGTTFVAYLFAAVSGFSAFGSYTGNGSTDGPFVFCGFRPRWVMIKESSSTGSWYMYDTARDAYNVMDTILEANYSNAETTASTLNFDVVSNGFKIRGTNGDLNTSTSTYIFAAFAENPFKYSLAR